MDFRRELENLLASSNSEIFDSELLALSSRIYANCKYIPPLFRYMPADYYSIRSIEQQSIFLQEVGKMNDVFEGLSDCTEDLSRMDIDGIHDIVYLKAFSEDGNNHLMWAHYGINYTGICIEYDLSDMVNHPEYYYHLFPVCYFERRRGHAISIKVLGKYLKEYKHFGQLSDAEWLMNIYSYYLIKSIDWEYEKEWRILVTNPQLNEEWYTNGVLSDEEHEYQYAISERYIDFPYIQSVRLGPRIEPDKREHIIDVCSRNSIPVYDMIISKNKYELKARRIGL